MEADKGCQPTCNCLGHKDVLYRASILHAKLGLPIQKAMTFEALNGQYDCHARHAALQQQRQPQSAAGLFDVHLHRAGHHCRAC